MSANIIIFILLSHMQTLEVPQNVKNKVKEITLEAYSTKEPEEVVHNLRRQVVQLVYEIDRAEHGNKEHSE